MKPLFAANHHWAMARGEESLRLEPARRHASSDAQRRMYKLEPAGLEVVEAWLSRYRTFWNEHLTHLEAQLREDQAP